MVVELFPLDPDKMRQLLQGLSAHGAGQQRKADLVQLVENGFGALPGFTFLGIDAFHLLQGKNGISRVYGRGAVIVVIKIASPVMLIALLVGLTVSLF